MSKQKSNKKQHENYVVRSKLGLRPRGENLKDFY